MRLFAAFAEVFSPVRCAGCDLPGAPLCDRCRAALPLIPLMAGCTRCGARLTAAGSCIECRGRAFSFEAAACAGVLDGALSRMLALYKDAGERRYAPLLGAYAAGAATRWRGWADAVVPIPPTRAARARRGFDHIAPIARAVADDLAAPLAPCLLALRRDDQRSLGRAARAANMAGAFEVLGVSPGARLLLVDDVMTTGATLDSAAAVLRAAGAISVRVVTIARAQDDGVSRSQSQEK